MKLQIVGASDAQGSEYCPLRVSAIYVRALIEALDAAGASVEDFLRAAGVSRQQFASPYTWVDVTELDRLTGLALELTGDPAFGLHWCERSPMTKFDLFSMIAAHGPTLRETLACLVRFQPILSERCELEVIERAGSASLRFVPLATTELSLRVRTELVVFGLVRLMRHVGAPSSAVRRIAFAYPAPAYVSEYARVFCDRARFEQPYSGIEFDSIWLDRCLDANLELHRILASQAEEVLTRVQNENGFSGQVRSYLRSQFPRLPEMREAARAMALSERSLRRRLAEEGFLYSAILQEGQLSLAQQLLAQATYSIQEVAFEVGFTSITAFYRAFKRWTGESPAAFRSAAVLRRRLSRRDSGHAAGGS